MMKSVLLMAGRIFFRTSLYTLDSLTSSSFNIMYSEKRQVRKYNIHKVQIILKIK